GAESSRPHAGNPAPAVTSGGGCLSSAESAAFREPRCGGGLPAPVTVARHTLESRDGTDLAGARSPADAVRGGRPGTNGPEEGHATALGGSTIDHIPAAPQSRLCA